MISDLSKLGVYLVRIISNCLEFWKHQLILKELNVYHSLILFILVYNDNFNYAASLAKNINFN